MRALNIGVAVVMGLVGLVGVISCGRGGQNGPVLYQNSEVLREYRQFRIGPLLPSPDATRMLIETKFDEGDGMVVKDLATGAVTHEMRADTVPLRVQWSPDGRVIAYFHSEAKTNLRRLFFWDLSSDRHREVAIPQSYSQRVVGWSPNSKRLAYVSDTGLVIVDPESSRAITSALGASIRWFDWSGDSRRLAVLPEETPATSIAIVDAETGQMMENVTCRQVTDLQQLAWRSSRLLLVDRQDNEVALSHPVGSRLIAIDPATGREEILASAPMGASEPVWLPGESGCMWHEPTKDHLQRIVTTIGSTGEPRAIGLNGWASHRAILTGGESIVAFQMTPMFNRMVKVGLIGDAPPVVLEENRGAHLAAASVETIRLRAADSSDFPIQVLRSSVPDKAGRAVFVRSIQPNTGGNSGNWARDQLLLNHGMDVIVLVDRPGKGTDDLIAACEYARDVMQIPRERIVLYGASDRAAAALGAAQRRPQSMGMVVVLGLLRAPVLPRAADRAESIRAIRVLAFHGEYDDKGTPEQARDAIERAIGPVALRPPRGLLHVIPGEDHGLKSDASHAMIYATIFHELGLLNP